MSYEIETVVRRPRSRGRLAAAVLAFGAAAAFLPKTALLVCAVVVGMFFFREAFGAMAEHRVKIVASREGLRVGARLVPRDAFAGALLSHEEGRTYVALRGRTNLDVRVPNNIEADALVRALGLDASSSTVEVPLTRAPTALDWAFVSGAAVTTLLGAIFLPWATAKVVAVACGLAAIFASVWLATRVHLRIGADGLVVRRPLRRDWFIPHDAIVHVASAADAILLDLAGGARVVFRASGLRVNQENTQRQREIEEQRADEMAAVVRRIQQAQQAFREHSADANALASVLDRGRRSTREWLEQLRRIGEGAEGAFRTMGVARNQLFEIVESTTASARERIAAAIALRARIADEEKPRVRIAAERCAEPELRERMIRVLDADDETEIERVIEEMSG